MAGAADVAEASIALGRSAGEGRLASMILFGRLWLKLLKTWRLRWKVEGGSFYKARNSLDGLNKGRPNLMNLASTTPFIRKYQLNAGVFQVGQLHSPSSVL